MPVVSIVIQKGGSGKTTTAINLAAALHAEGRRILLIDADPQANLSQSFGISDETDRNLYTEIKKEMEGEDGQVLQALREVKTGLFVLPASLELAGAELELISVYGREQIFETLLRPIKNQFDFIFIDCPHSIGMLTVNALTASDFVLIPLQAEFLPLKGVQGFMHHFRSIKKKLNPNLELIGILLTKFDERKKMNVQVRQQLQETFNHKVFQSHIRSNIQLAKAQEAGRDIFEFDRNAHGAIDYQQLAAEFLQKLNTNVSS